MATRYFGCMKGQQKTDVTQGASALSKDVEIKIDQSTNNLSKDDALLAIENIMNYITENQWPPS